MVVIKSKRSSWAEYDLVREENKIVKSVCEIKQEGKRHFGKDKITGMTCCWTT